MPPMAEAGCEDKIDRNVLGTVASTGFAELRARANERVRYAKLAQADESRPCTQRQTVYLTAQVHAFQDVLLWLDAIEADAKSGS